MTPRTVPAPAGPKAPATPAPRRGNVADETRRYLDSRPSIRDCIRYDIVNFTALARRIRRETGLESQEAVEIACRRYRRQMQEEARQEELLRTVVRASHLELRSHVASITVRGDIAFLGRVLVSSERSLVQRDRILQLFEGGDSVTILCDEAILAPILGMLPRESIISIRRRLSVVSVHSPEDVLVTPRVLSFLADAIGRWGINCVEMISVYTDTHFALRSQDALRAYEILSDLQRSTVDPRTEPPEYEGVRPAAESVPSANPTPPGPPSKGRGAPPTVRRRESP